MKPRVSRRRFMYGVASVAGATFAGPYILRAAEPNTEKLRIAFVGTGGQAGAHIGLVQKSEMKKNKEGKDELQPRPGITNGHACPAYCDVDKGHWDKIATYAPNAKQYTGYRKML